MGYIQSFNRYEIKYMLTDEQRQLFMKEAEHMLKRDKYGRYTICNLYLDTDDFYFIEHSLDKPIYKEKLRIRSYGNASDESKIFFEIKKKYNKVVYKRRIIIPFGEAVGYLKDNIRPPSLEGYSANQIFEEIDYLMKKYEPSPKLYLAYDREAFYVDGHPALRVTMDKNIRARWNELTLKTDEGAELLDTGIENYSLMEIKCPGALPVELASILTKLKIYPVSFSKYGRIYTEKFNKERMAVKC